MDSEENHSDPMEHQQQEEDESRHLLIRNLVHEYEYEYEYDDITTSRLWEEHQVNLMEYDTINYPVRRHEEENQGNFQVQNMNIMNQPVVRHHQEELQQDHHRLLNQNMVARDIDNPHQQQEEQNQGNLQLQNMNQPVVHRLLNRNMVAHDNNNPQQHLNLHQQQEEQNQGNLQLQNMMVYNTMNQSVFHPHQEELQQDHHRLFLNQNMVARDNYNNPQRHQNLHQQQEEQNQGNLQVQNVMVYNTMTQPVSVTHRHQEELQQRFVHQNTAVQLQVSNNQFCHIMLHNTTNNSQQHLDNVPIQQFPQSQQNLLMPNNAEIIPPNSENIMQNIPPGYRFVPSDQVLVNEYLKNKVENKPLPCNGLIHDVQIFDSNPLYIIEQYRSFEGQWYFFTPRDRKYPKGSRPRRNTVDGYWKPTGNDKTILRNNLPIGYKLVLDYYEGEHLNGTRTDLKMHEYRIQQKSNAPFTGTKRNPGKLDKWVLCKIYRSRRGNNGDDNQEGDQLMINQENHDPPLNGVDAGSSTMLILEKSTLNSNNNNRIQRDNSRMINTDADANIMPTLEESALNSSNVNLMQLDNARMINADEDADTMPTLEESVLNSSNDNLMQQNNTRMINTDADANTMPTFEESALNSEYTNNDNVMQHNNVRVINTTQSDFGNIPSGCEEEWTSTDISWIELDLDHVLLLGPPEPIDDHFFSDIEEDFEQEQKKTKRGA